MIDSNDRLFPLICCIIIKSYIIYILTLLYISWGGEVAQRWHVHVRVSILNEWETGGSRQLCSLCCIHVDNAGYLSVISLLQPVLPTGSTKAVSCVIIYV